MIRTQTVILVGVYRVIETGTGTGVVVIGTGTGAVVTEIGRVVVIGPGIGVESGGTELGVESVETLLFVSLSHYIHCPVFPNPRLLRPGPCSGGALGLVDPCSGGPFGLVLFGPGPGPGPGPGSCNPFGPY